jgi:hypothetical protein
MHHNDFVGFWAPRATLPDRLVPEVYRHLPRGPVVEHPFPAIWEFGRIFYIYQRIHDRRVIVASTEIPRHPQIRFRSAVPPDPQAILASPARTLIVHVRLPWEEDRVQTPGRRPWRMGPGRRRAYRRAGERLAKRLNQEWGPPDAGDGSVRVWDLERVRKGQQGPERSVGSDGSVGFRQLSGRGAHSTSAAVRASAAPSTPARNPPGR